MTTLKSDMREILETVRDAGAQDDSFGAEDWTRSDSYIEEALSALLEVVLEHVPQPTDVKCINCGEDTFIWDKELRCIYCGTHSKKIDEVKSILIEEENHGG